jgi:hypothetical protein
VCTTACDRHEKVLVDVRRVTTCFASFRACTIEYSQQAITSAISSKTYVEEREAARESKAGAPSVARR